MAQKPKARSKTKLSRRSILVAAGSGVAATALLKVSPVVQGKAFDPALIRPPGSLPEEEFLRKCIRCGECMKVCPANAIHPTLFQASLAGIWSPVVIPRVGYCEYNCTLCGQVCPTGAIQELTVEKKQQIHIGTAYVDRSRCLPFAYDTPCIVCEEHCPTSKKAIWLEEVTVTGRDGTEKTLKRPHVDPELCIGCGICEAKCPVNDRAAIIVTSAGETRNPDNQFLLSSSPYGDRRRARRRIGWGQ
jgi:MauM/NapG family ferredoxin protein